MIVMILISLLIVLLATAIIILKHSVTYWQRKGVFVLPPSLLFGNSKDAFLLKKHLYEELVTLYNVLKSKGERYSGYYLFWMPVFFIYDLDLVRNVLSKDFQHFTDHMNYLNEEADPLSGQLVTQKGAKWKALRAKLTPTFTSGKIKGMFQTIADCTKELPAVIDEITGKGEPLDIKEIFARYATDVIGSCAFGINCNCLKNPDTEFRTYGRKVFEQSFWQGIKEFLAVILPPKVLNFFNFSLTHKEIETFFRRLVKENMEYREKNNIVRKDFFQSLLDLRDRDLVFKSVKSENDTTGIVDYYQNGLTINEITAQCFVFFVGGFETSSTTLNFLMYELTMNLDVQDKLRNEIYEVLEKYDGKITYEAINEMSYLDKCIQETLRKYPPLHVISRECTKDYKVPDSNLVIEKGTPVFISAYAIQRDPDYYPDPEKFDPERFSEENKNKRPPFTFLAFGEGPRLCIGLRFGVLQVKVGLVALLRRYKFTLNSKTITPLQYDPAQFILTVKGGVWVDAEKVTEV